MASIDKIYGNKKQYKQLISFMEKNKKSYEEFTGEKIRKYIYNYFDEVDKDKEFPIVNLPIIGDVWLALNCEFKFVKNRLREMYNLSDEPPKKDIKLSMIIQLKESNNHDYAQATVEFEEVKEEFLRVSRLVRKHLKNEK